MNQINLSDLNELETANGRFCKLLVGDISSSLEIQGIINLKFNDRTGEIRIAVGNILYPLNEIAKLEVEE